MSKKSVKERYEIWKSDLDRTQGNSIEAMMGRLIDNNHLRNLKLRIKTAERKKDGLIRLQGSQNTNYTLLIEQVEQQVEDLQREQNQLELEIQENKRKLEIYNRNKKTKGCFGWLNFGKPRIPQYEPVCNSVVSGVRGILKSNYANGNYSSQNTIQEDEHCLVFKEEATECVFEDELPPKSLLATTLKLVPVHF